MRCNQKIWSIKRLKSQLLPLVSVVIPTYNQAHYLSDALRSVFSQTFTDWEIIIIDNYSTDNTKDIVEKFNRDRIHYIKFQNNGSIAASRNLGIRIAKGKWIAFLDSDDCWYRGKLEISLANAEQDMSITVISTNEYRIDSRTGKKKVLVYGPFSKNFYKTLLLYGNRLSPSATLVKKDFLVQNQIYFRTNSNYITVEDYDFWMLLARAHAKFSFINSIQGEYLIHNTNSSTREQLHQSSTISVLKDHVFKLQSFSSKRYLWRRVRTRLLFAEGARMISKKKYMNSLNCLLSALNCSTIGFISYLYFKMINFVKNNIKIRL
jgi:glycosyltransferase involved in cell wall biosynthesis